MVEAGSPARRLPPTLAVYAIAWLSGVLLGSVFSQPPAGTRLAGTQPGAQMPQPGNDAGPRDDAAAAAGLAIAFGATALAWRRVAPPGEASRGEGEGQGLNEVGMAVEGDRRAFTCLVLVAALWCLAGGLRFRSAVPQIDADHVAAHHGSLVELVGRIVAEPDRRDQRVGYRVRVTEVRTATGPKLAHGLVLVWGPVHPVQPYGALVRVRGQLEPPAGIEGFDYAGFLARQGIHSVIERATVEAISVGGGNPFVGALLRLKAIGRRCLAASLPQPEAALATGILLGDDKGIPRHTADAFRRTNTSHVIAISGSNISLLVAALSALLAGRLSARRSLPIVLGALTMYAVLVGADPAVVRAAIMGGLVVVAQTLGRPADAFIGLLAAAWAMTLYRPVYIQDLGFQLSFAATLGLIVLVPRLNHLAAAGRRQILGSRPSLVAGDELAPGPGELVIKEDRRHGATLRAEHRPAIERWLQEAVSTSIAAQLTTWPIIAHQVGQVSLAGLLANFLIVPVQPLVMGLGALTILAGLALPALGRIVGALAWLPLAFTIRIVEAAARLPLAAVPWRMPTAAMALYFAGLLIALLRPVLQANRSQPEQGGRPTIGSRGTIEPARSGLTESPKALAPKADRGRCLAPWSPGRLCSCADRHANGLLAGLGGACILVWLAVFHQPDGLLHIRMLDVGQGDAILAVAPNGRRMLIDGGPSPSAVLDRLGRYLAPWDRRLDVLVLTHPDADHLGGLPAVIERYRVAAALDSVASADTPNARQWQNALAESTCRQYVATAGMRIGLDERAGVWAEVLWPPSESAPAADDDPNGRSTVLRIQYGRTGILLTGDLEADGENALLAGGAALRADVLKVAHHGSESSTTPQFVAAVQPRLALIGVGATNRFGHPSAEVLARLVNVPVLRTDRHGDIEILSDGQDIWLLGDGCKSVVRAAPSP